MYLGVHRGSLGVLHVLITTWSEGVEVFADGGLHPGQSTKSQAPGHLGEEAEVAAGKDRVQPPACVLRLVLGCRGPGFASGMHSAGFGFHLLHSK